MQNKANFENDQMNTSTCNTSCYDNFRNFSRPKNKAKQSQNEPNFQCNYVKMGNLECEILSECVHTSYSILSVLRSLGVEGSPILALFFPKLALIRNKIVVLEHILKGWCADSRVEKACFGRPMQCTQKPSKTAATKPNQRQSAINLFCKFCCKTILLKYNLIFVYFLERKVNGEAIFRFDRRMGIQGVPSLCPQNA